jgi:hypothetical protein
MTAFAIVCGLLVWVCVVLSVLHFRHEKKRKQGLIDTKKKVAGKKFGVRQSTGEGVWDYEVEFDAKGDGMARAMARSKNILINLESTYSAASTVYSAAATDAPIMYRAVSDASTVAVNAEEGDRNNNDASAEMVNASDIGEGEETYGFEKMGLQPSFGMSPQDLLDWSSQQHQPKPDGATQEAGGKRVWFGRDNASSKPHKSSTAAAAPSAAPTGPKMTTQPAKVSGGKLSTRLSEENPSFSQPFGLSELAPMPVPPSRQKPEGRVQQEALAKEFSERQEEESRLSMLQHTLAAPSNGAPVSQADLDAQLELAEKMLPPGGYGWLSSIHKMESSQATSTVGDDSTASCTEVVVPRRGLPGAWGDEVTGTADDPNFGDDMSAVALAWGLFLKQKEEGHFSPPGKALSPGDTKYLQMPARAHASATDDEDVHSEAMYDNTIFRLKPTGRSDESEDTDTVVDDAALGDQRLLLQATGRSEESADTVVDYAALGGPRLRLKPTGQSEDSDCTEFDEATCD